MADGTYTVQSGDTLSAIATRNRTTVAKLQHLNGISDPNRLSVGEKLKLAPSPAATSPVTCSVCPLFLDPMRYPIEGVNYRIQCGPDTVTGTSEANGLGQKVTAKRGSRASISAQIPWKDNAWEQLADVAVEMGDKLVTLISPMTRVKGPLDPHPKDQFGQPKQESAPEKKTAQHPRGTPSTGKGKVQSEVAKGSGKGLHSRKETDKNGITRLVLTQDLPDLKDCFAAYTGEKITEADWTDAAGRLKCEVAAIKAFGSVESSGGGFFEHSGTPPLPKVRYERTHFSHWTGGKYDASNADLSMPYALDLSHLRREMAKSVRDPKNGSALKASYDAKHKIMLQDEAADRGKKRQHGMADYRRFINACMLDENAAIESCSWGMFQTMGENWQMCGFQTARGLLLAAFTSEREQLSKLFVPFVRKKADGKLKQAIIEKDWVTAAVYYNGANEAEANPPYHTKLKYAYEKFKHLGM